MYGCCRARSRLQQGTYLPYCTPGPWAVPASSLAGSIRTLGSPPGRVPLRPTAGVVPLLCPGPVRPGPAAGRLATPAPGPRPSPTQPGCWALKSGPRPLPHHQPAGLGPTSETPVRESESREPAARAATLRASCRRPAEPDAWTTPDRTPVLRARSRMSRPSNMA